MSEIEFLGSIQVVGTKALKKLPIKLAKEPLVEAIFEMRFDSDSPVASIWPGILYSELPGEKTMEHLPAIGIPKEVRDQDPNFQYAPLTKISWGNYWLLIGDRVFAVASKIPYQGWDSFKSSILEAFKIVLKTKMVAAVSRCSIKYIDILEGVQLDPSKCFDFELSLGGHGTAGEFHVRLSVEEGGILHILQVASHATVTVVSGRLISGPVLDVDSVMNLPSESSEKFLQELEARAELMHLANKRVVFGCLSDAAVEFLEPSYE